MMQLSQVASAVNGKCIGSDVMLANVSINTRADCQGRLFVALQGENFDAHQFLDQAANAGSAALMVEQDIHASLPYVKVQSTHQALKDLAAWWRSQFVLPVIGVTGSVGKTTVKEMLSHIFAELGQGVVTDGNLNNEIGVPLTLMRLHAQDRYAVIEMGMNHAGEISRLTKITRPTIALVNNAAAAHLEGLGTIEAVAQAKGEIYQGLDADGIAIVNADDDFAELWLSLCAEHKTLTFGLSEGADVTATYEEKKGGLQIKIKTKKDKFKVNINTVGEHSVRNVLAAVTVALAAKIPVANIKSGLAKFKPVNGRLNMTNVAGVKVIDDTYNANPASMRAAIDVLVKYPDTTLIVGDMGELGSAAEAEHRALGEQAALRGVGTLYACGKHADLVAGAFGGQAKAFSTQADLLMYLKQNLPNGAVLVKGSRSAKMERVIEALHTQLNQVANTREDTRIDHSRGQH